MVATPWGDSEKLKKRRLPPGRGTPAEEVTENQRARIFGAMVASVAELGYEATGVAEISEISGVSTRSLYNLFPGGKQECFLAVLDQILKATLTALSAAGEEEEDWERRLAAIYTRFAQMVAAQPAAASLVLTEAYAAGPAAVKALDLATDAFEDLSRRRLDESPERAGIPAAMIQAQVGALQELARSRLRRGEAATLPSLVPELVDLVAGYRPPPERLRPGNRRPAAETESLASSDEAERAIRGFTLAVADHGYAGTTIRQIARLGSMSLNTFYANFPDKRAVLLAAVDSAAAQMQAIAMAAFRRSPGWASGVRAAIGGLLGFLSARPATAKLLLAEVYAGGPAALEVRTTALGELTGVLEDGAGTNPEVPEIAPEAVIGGIIGLARHQFLREGAESLPLLTPVSTYIALAPYIGAQEASAVANADLRTRPGGEEKAPPSGVPLTRTKWMVTAILGTRTATVEALAEELGAPGEEIAGYLCELQEHGLVERITSPDPKAPPEWIAGKALRVIDGEDWAALTPAERHKSADGNLKMIASDIGEGLRRGVFGSRLDEHHSRLVVGLDQEGWTEMAEIHRAALEASQVVRFKSERRLRESGEKGIVGRSVQLLFELPDEE
jgi:AcrR family transcriptional regulator